MAYLYVDEDGDEAVKFELGKWDSVMGYYCSDCRRYIPYPMSAHDHENNRPDCQDRIINRLVK